MTKEIIHEARIYCDGCGYAVVESTVGYIDRAFEQCGWLHTTTPHGAEMDYCPVCRADNPFKAVQRVRELAEFWKAQVADSPSGASWIYMSAASRLLLDALDGGSDE